MNVSPIMPLRPEQDPRVIAVQNEINFLTGLVTRPFSGNMNWRDKENAVSSLKTLEKSYRKELKRAQDDFNVRMEEYKKQLIIFQENERVEKEAQILHEKRSNNPFYNLNIPEEN